MSLKGAIFDLDGVVVDTVPLHFKAWKRLFEGYGRPFTFEDYKAKVDGIPRLDGARAILKDLSEEQIQEAGRRKQNYFLENLKTDGISTYESTLGLIRQLKEKDVKIAIISSSRNCPYILEKTKIYEIIDAQVCGTDVTMGKPHPQIFLTALDKLGIRPEDCIVFEDASLGVEAAKRAGIITVGVDRHKDPKRLKKSDLVVEDLGELDYERLESLLKK